MTPIRRASACRGVVTESIPQSYSELSRIARFTTPAGSVRAALPDNIELVVGVGGGRALDASKFVAREKRVPLILVPTIISSGTIVHGFVAKWKGRRLIGDGEAATIPSGWRWN